MCPGLFRGHLYLGAAHQSTALGFEYAIAQLECSYHSGGSTRDNNARDDDAKSIRESELFARLLIILEDEARAWRESGLERRLDVNAREGVSQQQLKEKADVLKRMHELLDGLPVDTQANLNTPTVATTAAMPPALTSSFELRAPSGTLSIYKWGVPNVLKATRCIPHGDRNYEIT